MNCALRKPSLKFVVSFLFLHSQIWMNATAQKTASIIFIHGLSGSGPQMCGMLQGYWKNSLPSYISLRCPSAKSIDVYGGGRGGRMPAWFKMQFGSNGGFSDVAGIRESVLLIHNLIDEEIRSGIPVHHIVIAGHSQGGAIAISSAFTYRERLGGLVLLSTWLPLGSFEHLYQVAAKRDANRNIPVFQTHGTADTCVNISSGRETAQAVQKLTNQLQFKTYAGMGHGFQANEMQDFLNFVIQVASN